MKIPKISRSCALFMAVALPSLAYSQTASCAPSSSCATGGSNLGFESVKYEPALIGFSEFGLPSIPAKKYRRSETTGTMTVGTWSTSSCVVESAGYAPL
jgi:hypothetical protein